MSPGRNTEVSSRSHRHVLSSITSNGKLSMHTIQVHIHPPSHHTIITTVSACSVYWTLWEQTMQGNSLLHFIHVCNSRTLYLWTIFISGLDYFVIYHLGSGLFNQFCMVFARNFIGPDINLHYVVDQTMDRIHSRVNVGVARRCWRHFSVFFRETSSCVTLWRT